MSFSFVRAVAAAALASSVSSCYSLHDNMPTPDVHPQTGVWHLVYKGEGEESQDYHIKFQKNGGAVVYDGKITSDENGRRVTQDVTPIVYNPLFSERNNWEHGRVVLHTEQNFGGYLVSREYTLVLQDPRLMVGTVNIVTRVNGIYSKSAFRASATLVKAEL